MTAPLDARAFLIIGNEQLRAGRLDQATRTLEAGQRLDPRNRLIHLLLLERYLRRGSSAAAAAQFAVLARLVESTQPIIATAMAKMMMTSDMRPAVRQTLAADQGLEREVLIALAKTNTSPSEIFALASPAALADAGGSESWGPVLISRLVANGQYAAAKAIWSRLYRLSEADLNAPIFNPGFRKIAASAPFNWTLIGGSIGAADPHNGSLSVDYYDRESGDLATQLLVLAPGSYQFSFVVDGSKTNATPNLFWTITCAHGAAEALKNVAVPELAATRRAVATFTVPNGCPAQALTLRGEASEFPSPVNLSIRNVEIKALTGSTS